MVIWEVGCGRAGGEAAELGRALVVLGHVSHARGTGTMEIDRHF